MEIRKKKPAEILIHSQVFKGKNPVCLRQTIYTIGSGIYYTPVLIYIYVYTVPHLPLHSLLCTVNVYERKHAHVCTNLHSCEFVYPHVFIRFMFR